MYSNILSQSISTFSFVDPTGFTATTLSLAVSSRKLIPDSAFGSTKLITQQIFRGSREEIPSFPM